jgi:hypothetical protein
MLKEMEVRIEGVSPLIMHSGQMADPTNRFAKALKEISGKRKKTDADHEAMSRIELEAGLYQTNGIVTMPGDCIEACIIAGAAKMRLGKVFRSGVFCDLDGKFLVNGRQVKAETVLTNPEYKDSRAVVIGKARIIRTRPIFRNWSCEFKLYYNTDVIANAEQVIRALTDSGQLVGLCDFRPKYGRFTVEMK